jgi:hypothetical protein
MLMQTRLAEPKRHAPYTLCSAGGVHVFDAQNLVWQPTPSPGLMLKPVREDPVRGQFLGLVLFEPDTRSGIHQHQGVATSFVVDGGLTDYWGSLGIHQAGINVRGATHDAAAYQRTVLVSRLEAPVTYLPDGYASGVHVGSSLAEFRNDAPDVPPDLNVSVDTLEQRDTGIAGVTCQVIFDYRDTGSDHRMVQLRMRPGARVSFTAGALTELWVRGGVVEVNSQGTQQQAAANHFVVCEEGAQVTLTSPFGAIFLAWADAAPRGTPAALFGF